jgi:hypothetical protein
VLVHLIYFHEATAWGIRSVGVGGPVWAVPAADWDSINEIGRVLHEGETPDELMVQIPAGSRPPSASSCQFPRPGPSVLAATRRNADDSQ